MTKQKNARTAARIASIALAIVCAGTGGLVAQPAEWPSQRVLVVVGFPPGGPADIAARALVDGLWVEVPTYRNAKRLLERARRLAEGQSGMPT